MPLVFLYAVLLVIYCLLYSNKVEARRDQTHLATSFFLFSQRLDTSRHLAIFFSYFSIFLTFKLSKLFWKRRLCFKSQLRLTNSPRTFFSFPLSLHSEVYRACKRYVINASSEEEPSHFLIYRCITAFIPSTTFKQINYVTAKSIQQATDCFARKPDLHKTYTALIKSAF